MYYSEVDFTTDLEKSFVELETKVFADVPCCKLSQIADSEHFTVNTTTYSPVQNFPNKNYFILAVKLQNVNSVICLTAVIQTSFYYGQFVLFIKFVFFS